MIAPMSSFRVHAIAGRVVIVHDMCGQTTFSELDVEQADVLLQQLERAKKAALLSLGEQSFLALLADTGSVADSPVA